jgi:amino acid adenylation domain-containing protein
LSDTADISPLVASLLEDRMGGAQCAVRFGETMMTYTALRDAVLSSAAALHEAGVRPGDRVAICLPKSLASLTLILGTLAAGAAYVPLNHRLPAAQLHAILEDLQPRLFIAGAAVHATLAPESLPGLRVASAPAGPGLAFGDVTRFPGNASVPPSPEGLAAVLYTSGTTGEPKGIMLSHDNLFSFSDWAARTFRISARDTVSSHAPFHFDLSIFDIFTTLQRHATLCLLDEATTRFAGAVRRVIESAQITVWYSVPTALAQLQERGALKGLNSLRLVLFAGEVFPTPILRRAMAWLPATEFVNLYGPTETNVCSWYRVPGPPDSDFDTLPIGGACDHLDVTLLDEDGKPVAPGETGEICVAGSGVMMGYWRRPGLTEASRVNFRAGTYRTGDYGVLRRDGMTMLLGRRDQQVKVRGHRIELLALEATLNAHPAVREAIAVPAGDAATRRLSVFLTARDAPVDAAILRSFVASRLAPYYVPDRIEWVTDLPRTATGKVDRGALNRRVSH